MESPEKAVATLNSIKSNFAKLLKDNGEIITIKTKNGPVDYVKYEGWVTIATVLGVMPRVIELKESGPGTYQAKAEAIAVKNGQVVGSAYGICSNKEENWAGRELFAISSMAQTRACAKALKTILSGVITHIGYSGTPAELAEVEANKDQKPTNGDRMTEPQWKKICVMCKEKEMDPKQKIEADFGAKSVKDVTKKQASELIERLMK